MNPLMIIIALAALFPLGLLMMRLDNFKSRVGATFLLAMIYFLSFKSIDIFNLINFSIDSTKFAISHSSYQGISKLKDIVSVYTIFGIFIAGLALLPRVLHIASTDPERVMSRRFSYSIFFFSLVIFFIFFTDVNQYGLYDPSIQISHANDYDSQNVITWQYLHFRGLVELKDFWFPYSGYIFLLDPTIEAHVLSILNKTVIFILFYLATAKLFENDTSKIVILLGIWTLLYLTNVFTWTERYYPALLILSYHSFSFSQWRNNRALILLAAVCLYFVNLEPVQLLYCMPGVLASFVLSYRKLADYFFRLYVIKYATMLLTVFIYLLLKYKFFASQSNFIDFYRELPYIADYSSFPSQVRNLFVTWSVDQLYIVLWLCSILLLFLNINYNYKKIFDNQLTVTLQVCFLITSAVIYQKSNIRPSVAPQLIVVPFYLYLVQVLSLNSGSVIILLRKHLFLVLLTFLLVTFSIQSELYVKLSDQVQTRVSLLRNNFFEVFNFRKAKQFEASYFSKAAFINANEEYSELIRKFGPYLSASGQKLYVLGDESYLYLIFNKKLPYYITFYNQSFIWAQRNSLDFMSNADYIILNKNFKDFDVVPNVLRVPLLYKYASENFTPVESAGNYVLLKKEAPDKVNLEFWTATLGSKIDYGYLANIDIEYRVNPNDETLLILPNLTNSKESVEVKFKSTLGTYSLMLRKKHHYNKLIVHLDRLWFWKLNKLVKFDISASQHEKQVGYFFATSIDDTRLY